jgi:hypothetical protein
MDLSILLRRCGTDRFWPVKERYQDKLKVDRYSSVICFCLLTNFIGPPNPLTRSKNFHLSSLTNNPSLHKSSVKTSLQKVLDLIVIQVSLFLLQRSSHETILFSRLDPDTTS